jgi:signal peptidase II
MAYTHEIVRTTHGRGRSLKGYGRVAVLGLVIGATIGCDRATKNLAEARLAGAPPRSFLTDTVRLEYAENTGGFLSLGADLPLWARAGLFTVGTGVALAVIPLLALRLGSRAHALMGLGLIWAGGASNLVDRVSRGSVVDFLNVGIGPVRTGVFNVADLAITVGALVVALGWGPGVRGPRLPATRRTAGER